MFKVFYLRANLLAIVLFSAIAPNVFAQQPVPPLFIPQAGIYADPVQIQLMAGNEDVIYYTLDGSDPDSTSSIFTGSLFAGFRADDSPNLLMIDRVSHGYMTYAPPKSNVQMATVVRARSYRDGMWSRTSTASYFIHPEGLSRFQLPILSIVTDSTNFFAHDEGIYVTGIDFENWQNEGNNRFLDMTFRGSVPANYFRRGREHEKPAHFEMFETDGRRVLAQDIGVRIHGGLSRALRLKSLRLYSRSDYGVSRFRYQIFPDQELDNFNRLVLRASGQDVNKTMFRDAMMQSLVKHLSFETQAYRPALLFLNGEFWGIHNIRERYDNDYFEIKYGLEPEQIDYLSGNASVIEGSRAHYVSMLDHLSATFIDAKSRYELAQTRMDMQNFTEYMLSNIYFNNRDWPHNNIDFWRYKAPNGYDAHADTPLDGRWRWMMFDTDMGYAWTDTHRESTYLSHVYTNTIQRVTRADEWSTRLLRILLTFPQFKEQFANTHMDLMNSAFQPDRALGVINRMSAAIEPHIQEHMDRMGYHHDRWRLPQTLEEWDEAVGFMRRFAVDRPDTLNEHMRIHLGFNGYTPVHIGVNDTTGGYIQINSIAIRESTPGIKDIGNPSRWTGQYFTDNTITVTAHPKEGWIFDYWQEYSDSTQTMRLIPSGNDLTLTAVFTQSVSINDEREALPHEVQLFQNYPNPFNPITTIRFTIPEQATIRLEIFDIMGRSIAVLADEYAYPGVHQRVFDASMLSSGHYIYRLNVDGIAYVRSLTLLK
jgi:hypothetical protein